MGSFGRLSWWAKVMPGLELGLVWLANGACASEEYDWVLFFADSAERTAMFSEPDMVEAFINVSSRDAGWVNVRTAMANNVS